MASTDGSGEDSARIRAMMAWIRLKPLGPVLDEDANRRMAGGTAGIMSAGDRIFSALVNTDEEWMIARDTGELAGLTGSAVTMLGRDDDVQPGPGRGESFNRATQQAHEPSDIPGASRIVAPRRIPRFGEQTANQLVRHVQHCIRQPGLEVEDGCDQDRTAPAGGRPADLVCVRQVALAHELPQPFLVDRPGAPGWHPTPRTSRSRSSSLRMWSAFGVTGGALSQPKGVKFSDASNTSSCSSVAICSACRALFRNQFRASGNPCDTFSNEHHLALGLGAILP